jgi:hypothetical protein
MTVSLHPASFSVRSVSRMQTVSAFLHLNYACVCGQE